MARSNGESMQPDVQQDSASPSGSPPNGKSAPRGKEIYGVPDVAEPSDGVDYLGGLPYPEPTSSTLRPPPDASEPAAIDRRRAPEEEPSDEVFETDESGEVLVSADPSGIGSEDESAEPIASEEESALEGEEAAMTDEEASRFLAETAQAGEGILEEPDPESESDAAAVSSTGEELEATEKVPARMDASGDALEASSSSAPSSDSSDSSPTPQDLEDEPIEVEDAPISQQEASSIQQEITADEEISGEPEAQAGPGDEELPEATDWSAARADLPPTELGNAAELEEAAELETGDPGDLPEPPAGDEVLDLPSADVPAELGWNVLPMPEAEEVLEVPPPSPSPKIAERVEAPREPLWEIPSFEPVEASEFDDGLEVSPTMDVSAIKATEARFRISPDKLVPGPTRVPTAQEQFAEVIRVLKDEAGQVEGDLRAAYWLAVARLLVDEGRFSESREAMRQSLAANDTFAPTLRFRVHMSRAEERWADLADCFETQALATAFDRTRAEALISLAEVRLEHLSDTGKAATDLAEALDAAPDDLNALYLLADVHESHQQWQEYAAVSERLATRLPTEGKALLLCRLGINAEIWGPGATQARDYYLRAMALKPSSPLAGVGLERIDRANGDLAAVRARYLEEAGSATGPSAIYDWLQAVDLSDALSEPDAALHALEKAVECAPENGFLHRELLGRLARAGKYDEYAQRVHAHLAHVQDLDASALLHVFVAQVYETVLSTPEEALRLLEEAGNLAPDWSFPQRERLRLLEEMQKPQALVDMLVAAAETESIPSKRAVRYYQAALAAEKHLNAEAALPWFKEAVVSDPGEAAYAFALRQRIAWDDALAQLPFTRVWPFEGTFSAEVAELELRGAVAEFSTKDEATALDWYWQAFSGGSRSPLALGGLFRILRRLSRYEELKDLYMRLEQENPQKEIQGLLQWERLRLLMDCLNRPDEALALHDEAFAQTTFVPALQEKLSLCWQLGRTQELMSLRENLISLGMESPRASFEMLAEALHWARRGNPRALEELTRETDDSLAFDLRELWLWEQGDTVGLAQVFADRLARGQEKGLAPYLSLRRATWLETAGQLDEAYALTLSAVLGGAMDGYALQQLERLGSQLSRLESVVGVYKSLAARAQDARLTMTIREAMLLEHGLGDVVSALEAYQEAWTLDPECYEAFDGVARLAGKVGRPEDAAPAFAARAARYESPMDAAVDFFQAGRLFARMQEDEKAEQALTQVLEHGLMRERAFDLLVDLYRRRGDVQGLETNYDAWISKETNPLVRLCWVMELADQLESLGALRAAMMHFERMATADQYLPACLRLERISLVSEDWKRYCAALELRADVVKNEATRALAKETALQVQAGKLRDVFAMEQLEQRQLKATPYEAGTVDRYILLLAAQKRFTELVQFLEEQARNTPAIERKVRFLLDVGWLYAYALEQPELAFDRYQDVLDLVEGQQEALAALIDISVQRQDWGGLVAALARKAVSLDFEGRVSAYRDIARIWDEKLHDPETAIQAWRKVIETQPDDLAALSALTDLCRRQKTWEGFVEMAERWLTLRRDEDPELLNEIGITYARRLDKPDKAVPFLLRALVRGQGDLEMIEDIARRFERDGRYLEATELLERLASAMPDEEQRADRYQKVAELAREHLEDLPRATRALEALLAQAPSRLSARWSLVRVLEEQERFEEALEALETLATHSGIDTYLTAITESERQDFHRCFARLFLATGDKVAAIEPLEALVRINPSDREALQQLIEIFRQLSRWERLAWALETLLAAPLEMSPEARADAYDQLGEAQAIAGNVRGALEAYQNSISLVKNRVGTYLAMIGIYRRLEDWNAQLGLYNHVIKYSSEPEQVVDAYLRKADILLERMTRQDGSYLAKAAMHYEKAVLYDRRNAYAMLRLAEISFAERQFQKTQDWLRRTLAVDPKGEQLGRTLLVGGALCAEAQKDIPAALANFRRAAQAWEELEEHLPSLATQLEAGEGFGARFVQWYRSSLPYRIVL